MFFISINIDYEWLHPLVTSIFMISLISLALFFLLYIAHLFPKNKHKAICSHNTITIEGNSYLLSEIKIRLNMNAVYIPKVKTKQLKKIPFWSNYIILENGVQYEFSPNDYVVEHIENFNIEGYKKRSLSMMKTSEILIPTLSLLSE